MMPARLEGFSHLAITAYDIARSRRFYEDILGLPVLMSNEHVCAFILGTEGVFTITTHPETPDTAFSEFTVGLDHVCFAVPDSTALDAWKARLADHGIHFDERRSGWGLHVNLRDPDNIAIELLLLEPDPDTQALIDAARREQSHPA